MNLQTREKISNTLKGKSKSEHHKEKLREAWKHRKKIEPSLDSYVEEKRLEEKKKGIIKSSACSMELFQMFLNPRENIMSLTTSMLTNMKEEKTRQYFP